MRVRLIAESGEVVPAVCEIAPDGQEVVKLGRNSKNTVVLQDRHASRWHAEIARQDDRWFLRDRGTTNGTHLNGIRIARATRARERPGDSHRRYLLPLSP